MRQTGEIIMATTYQGPFLIQWVGSPLQEVCLQAAYPGQDAFVTINTIDPTGNTSLQLWLYGSDERLYLYAGSGSTPKYCLDFTNPAQNGQPLMLNAVTPSDQTQQWTWNGASNTSTFNNIGAQGFSMDNDGGGIRAGNKIQLWQTANNANQDYVMALIPALAAMVS
jgi:hypothetical protein